mmetsp:Transcript_14974/g.31748  ORF Transcript_14974/g.31748 Transcript_14974/m.31748 type:complete len:735 (-) Transcript_14974:69-2273(-)
MVMMTSLRIRGRHCFAIFICLCLQLIICCATLGKDGVHENNALYTRFDPIAYYSNSAAHGIDITPAQHRQRLQQQQQEQQQQQQYSYDDENKCTTYLAPSSIPNSGLGMYTTQPYRTGESFPFPEIGIVLSEKNRHYSVSIGSDVNKRDSEKLINQYPWAAQSLTLGEYEVGFGEVVIPGLGMLANSHLGLVNIRHSDLWKIQSWRDGTDSYVRSDSFTREDVGRGAQSWHGRTLFSANVNIGVGDELFVSYGDEWFLGRERLLGLVPLGDDFKEADRLLKEFSQNNDMNDESNYAQRNANYEKMLTEAHNENPRLRKALPNNMQDVPKAVQMGTARFSAPSSNRPVEWLEENGACIDNIISGVSTIPQAGRGAFATRSIQKGQTITTTPVVTLERKELHLWEERQRRGDGGQVMEFMGHQLLLNYCYGHSNSSLLFFPYAPTVNFINHGSVDDANAEIRWSTLPYHKGEWLEETLEGMKDMLKTGLLFDIVATKDMRRGDEVLLYYGKDWEESWTNHVEEWMASMNEEDGVDDDGPILNITERLGLPTTHDLNQMDQNPTVRTQQEQLQNPYPDHIMTRCQYDPPEAEECTKSSAALGLHCQSRWTVSFDAQHIYPCTILTRTSIQGTDWYSAKVEVPVKNKNEVQLHLVEYMTRDAVRFVDKPYSRDQYSYGVFRKEIGLPEGIMPEHWLDGSEEEEEDVDDIEEEKEDVGEVVGAEVMESGEMGGDDGSST